MFQVWVGFSIFWFFLEKSFAATTTQLFILIELLKNHFQSQIQSKNLKTLIYFHKSHFYRKIVSINKPRSRLRFFSYLCPISRIKIYYSNVQRFYELADIGNILKILQDLDKLKWTFFQSKENKFYDLFSLQQQN